MKAYFDLNREDGQQLQIQTHYNEGGMSMFDYYNRKRGFYVSFRLVNINNGSVSYLLMDDNSYKMLMVETTRNSKKKLEKLDAALNSKLNDLVQLFKENKRAEILAIVTNLQI